MRELKYSIQVRQAGEPWRTTWSGPGEAVACQAARRLGEEMRVIDGFDARAIPVHPYVRVLQNKRVVLAITPESRLRVVGPVAREAGVRHGVDCRKAPHRGGDLHGEDDDSPFDDDGVRYCGRCHYAL